ncbi:hypothetical protein FZ103_00255 [Streptomonospora sp. PA3]|uniref:hypothetical protein n=1 Tax=Streptomonospora sp. PA3 TaxID=2607326 RepID=UPI0012DDFA8F|nr:hypothetical protein [Streptomonospora sp. PA3]MUL39625.1 hypothetical protein [Streptomonospora sp. PA3]
MTTTLPVHPRTGLRAIGHTSRGPVWPQMGGDPTGAPSGQSGGDGQAQGGGQQQGGSSDSGSTPPAGGQPAPTPPAGAPQQQSQQGQTGAQQQSGGQQGGDGDDLAQLSQADLARMVRDLRKENASARTNAKQQAADDARQDFAQKIGKALGLVTDDQQKADPDKLAEQLSNERRERYAEKAARAADLDPDRLLDSREFEGKLRKLDPAASDFQTALNALVKEYKDDPRYKTTSTGQAPARSGGDFSGGPGNTPTFTREQIARMTPAEYAKNRDAIMAQLSKSK